MPKEKFAYIISNYKFHKHWKLQKAKKEKERLEKLFPSETFRIYWVRPKVNKFGDPVDHLPKQKKQEKLPEKKAARLVLKLKNPVKVKA